MSKPKPKFNIVNKTIKVNEKDYLKISKFAKKNGMSVKQFYEVAALNMYKEMKAEQVKINKEKRAKKNGNK